MAGINKVILVGNVGADPDILMFGDKKKAIFSLATNCQDREKTPDVQWHRIICWQNLADDAEKLVKKGSLVCVEGYLNYRVRKDRNDFSHRETEIVTEKLQVISTKLKEPKQEETLSKIIFGDTQSSINNFSKELNEDNSFDIFEDFPF